MNIRNDTTSALDLSSWVKRCQYLQVLNHFFIKNDQNRFQSTNLYFYISFLQITPSNRDGIELQRNCSNKKPQNAITAMYLFTIDIPPRIPANVNCPHSAFGISQVSLLQGRTRLSYYNFK